jgi:beta-galactosidase GanA
MEGYDVIALGDDKVGEAVGTENGYLIVETGMLRKTKHAVPLDMARAEDDEKVVRLTVSKEMVEEGPKVDDGDWQAVADYYGRGADLEGQAAADIPTADQTRAELRDSLSQTPGVPSGPAAGSTGIHQDRWETKE